jgi:hypothetical protein
LTINAAGVTLQKVKKRGATMKKFKVYLGKTADGKNLLKKVYFPAGCTRADVYHYFVKWLDFPTNLTIKEG